MSARLHGLIVTGGRGPLDGLGVSDPALTPFAGKYRFIDFALAAFANSTVTALHLAASRPSPALRAHLVGAARAAGLARPPAIRAGSLPCRAAGRAARIVRALLGCRHLVSTPEVEVVVVLTADHVLQLDLRQLVAAHRRAGADVTLCAVPLPPGEAGARALLEVAGRRVRDVPRPAPESAVAPASCGLPLAWTGDLAVSTAALPALQALLPAARGGGDAELLGALARSFLVATYDVLDNSLPGVVGRGGVFWHDPVSLEAYYDAQMNLCTPTPALDLYNTAWPVRPAASGLGPAKVVGDAAGRVGQALNALVSDGAVIRGGMVRNTVLGHGVVVESGAEVEDSVLLDGCRVGRGARVRRAVVGAGAVIGDAGEVGYTASPASPAWVRRSGLTVVPALSEAPLAATGAR